VYSRGWFATGTLVPSRRTPCCVSSSSLSGMVKQPSSPGVPLGEVPHRHLAGVHRPLGRPERTFPLTTFLPAQGVSSPNRSSKDLPLVARRDPCHPLLRRPPSPGQVWHGRHGRSYLPMWWTTGPAPSSPLALQACTKSPSGRICTACRCPTPRPNHR
jgi:hypothetical protein